MQSRVRQTIQIEINAICLNILLGKGTFEFLIDFNKLLTKRRFKNRLRY